MNRPGRAGFVLRILSFVASPYIAMSTPCDRGFLAHGRRLALYTQDSRGLGRRFPGIGLRVSSMAVLAFGAFLVSAVQKQPATTLGIGHRHSGIRGINVGVSGGTVHDGAFTFRHHRRCHESSSTATLPSPRPAFIPIGGRKFRFCLWCTVYSVMHSVAAAVRRF